MNSGLIKGVVKAAYWWGAGNFGMAAGLKAAEITKAKSITKVCAAFSGLVLGEYVYDKTKYYVEDAVDQLFSLVEGVEKAIKGE